MDTKQVEKDMLRLEQKLTLSQEYTISKINSFLDRNANTYNKVAVFEGLKNTKKVLNETMGCVDITWEAIWVLVVTLNITTEIALEKYRGVFYDLKKEVTTYIKELENL